MSNYNTNPHPNDHDGDMMMLLSLVTPPLIKQGKHYTLDFVKMTDLEGGKHGVVK